MDARTDKVLTVVDDYDGPVSGIANYKGEPHFYELLFNNEEDDFERDEGGVGLYCLRPIDEVTLKLALEDWEIWKRWHAAFTAGETAIETHPALPEDRHRHLEIKSVLDAQLGADCTGQFKAHGKFILHKRGQVSGLNPDAEWEVEWRPALA